MQKYMDVDNDSGVVAFAIEPESIKVRFSDGAIYVYTYASAGVSNIEQMKRLAQSGEGLNSFIMRHVRKRYAHKE